jgi:hypothetical protein
MPKASDIWDKPSKEWQEAYTSGLKLVSECCGAPVDDPDFGPVICSKCKWPCQVVIKKD